MTSIPEIDVESVKNLIDSDEEVFILDVRETEEFELTNIGGTLIPLGELPDRLAELGEHRDSRVVVLCRTGGRSAQAVSFLLGCGFSKAVNMRGGVHAWSDKIDSSVIKY
ncbi:MAG: rhodanese-like domain-containing protein [Rhodothermales bacterium]|nr:rhodanese-like domain-containing protein [Rhodothermales bacterium]